MRLVAQRPAALASHKMISEPWWDKFVFNTIDNDTFWSIFSLHEKRRILREALKKHGADLIETHVGVVLDFDNDAAATAFVLRWS